MTYQENPVFAPVTPPVASPTPSDVNAGIAQQAAITAQSAADTATAKALEVSNNAASVSTALTTVTTLSSQAAINAANAVSAASSANSSKISAANSAAVALAAANTAVMPLVVASSFGFDPTGVVGCGAILHSMLADNVKFPKGFELWFITPGLYRWGDFPADDNMKQYRIRCVPGVVFTVSPNNNDCVRVRNNDIQWLDCTWDYSDIDYNTYTPSFFVLGYNGGNGSAARNFTVTGTLNNVSGKFIDYCQGNGMVLTLRNNNLRGRLVSARSTSTALPYKGGDDQQNGKFMCHNSKSYGDWIMYGEPGSTFGSHDFPFWKQNDQPNGVKCTVGNNRALMFYTERTRLNSTGVPGIPFQSPGGDAMHFSGGTDDCDYINAQAVGQTDGARGMNMSKAQNFGSLLDNVPTQNIDLYYDGAAGIHSLNKNSGDGGLTWGVRGTNNSCNIDFYNTQNPAARVRIRPMRIGFYANNSLGSSQRFMSGLLAPAVTITFLSNGDTLNANSVFYKSVTVPGVKVGDFVIMNPPSRPPAGSFYAPIIVTGDNTVDVPLVNATNSNITPAGGITGDYTFNIINMVTTA